MMKPIKPRDWKIGTSTFLFGGLTKADLAAGRDAGLECVEVCLFGKWFDPVDANFMSYCEELAAFGRDLGIEFWSIHLPFGQERDISSLDETARSATVRELGDLLEFAACFRPQKAVIHASSEPIEPNAREVRLEQCRKSLSELVGVTRGMEIQLAVECLPRTCLGNNAVEMARLIDGMESLGICCDTNHLLTERTEDFIHKMGRKVVTLHVSDYDMVDERHWLPGLGSNDWSAIIKALDCIGYDGPIMFEVGQRDRNNPVLPVHLRQCWNRLLDIYEAAQA